MLIKSNEAPNCHKLIGKRKIVQLELWQTKVKLRLMLHEELGAYIHYDLRNENPIRFVSSSSFTPFAGIPTNERAATIIQTMMTKFEESICT
jgi:neutral trehalase